MGALAVESHSLCRIYSAAHLESVCGTFLAVTRRILTVTMRSIKIFITIVSILLLSAIGAGIYVWYEVQTYQKALRKPQQFDVSTQVKSSQTPVETVLE